MERIYHLVTHRPGPVLGVIAVVTLVLGFFARDIRPDSSVDTLLRKDDPGRVLYREVLEQFGSDEVGIVGILADDVYTPAVIAQIDRLGTAIAAVDGVEGVLSLTTAPNPLVDLLDPPRLVEEIPPGPAAIRELHDAIDELPIYEGVIVSEDGRGAAINVFFEPMSDDEFLARGTDEKIQAIVEAANDDGTRVVYSGLPHLKAFATRAMQQDLRRLVPLTLVVIAIILFWSFRSLRGVVLPTLTVVIALVWTLGIMVLTGGRLTLASTALPPLVLVLGTAYALHVIAEYFERARPGEPIEEVLSEILRKTTPPVFIAAVTTMLGFLSLAVNPIVSIQEMGLYSALGIFLAFLLAIVFVPAVLALLRPPKLVPGETFSPGIGRWLARLGRFDARHRGPIIFVTCAIAVWALWQARLIQVDSNFQSFFREDSPVSQATRAVNERLSGAMAFHVVVDAETEGAMLKLDTLRRLRDLQRFIDSIPGIRNTVSFVDYAELFDRANQQSGGLIVTEEGEVIEAPASSTTFWEEPSQLGAVRSMIASSPDVFSAVVTPDLRRSNMLVQTSLARASEIESVIGKIRAFAAKTFPPELEVIPTGTLVLHTRTTSNVVRGQFQSLGLAALVIFVVMSGMFLSFRVGFVAMLPNLFPILVFFGLMGTTGAVLSLATSIIASIALGIAVDDTVHVMTRLSQEVRETGDQEKALDNALTTVGKPVFFSTIFLALGFLVLCLSSFVPIQEFGWLAAATIVVALLADVIFLPAMIATMRIITLWDVLYVALGKDPHRTIPLFATLRPWQAKIVALMGQLKSFPRGAAIVRQGELGNEMYVIIDGRADVVVHTEVNDTRKVRELGRGDVFGEMGLIRHHERTADVLASEDVQLMAMDESFLDRVQRRYPRIATKIFINIAKILSDRLQDETRRAA